MKQVKAHPESRFNYDKPESPMLHTKFPSHQPTGSGEEFLEGFLPHTYVHDGHLGHVTKPI